MMIPNSAIAPIRAVEAATQVGSAVAPTAISASGTSVLPQIAPATTEATDKFKALMDNVKLSKDAGALARPYDSALAKIVAHQDSVVGDIAQDVARFQRDASLMNPREFAAESVQLQYKMAEIATTIQMGVSFAQGGKNAVQNLMKNQ